MQLRSFSALLLSVASEAGANRMIEWRSSFPVKDGLGATETYEIVFALDADFYEVGLGDELEEILRVTSSVHVDHPDPFNDPHRILTEYAHSICFEVPEDLYCIAFWKWEEGFDQFQLSTGGNPDLVEHGSPADREIDFKGRILFDDGVEVGWGTLIFDEADWNKIMHKIDIPVIESDATGWTKFQTVDIRFASGVEQVEEVRKEVYNGTVWADFRIERNVRVPEEAYITSSLKDEGWDNTFRYEVLDSCSDLHVLEQLTMMDEQLESLVAIAKDDKLEMEGQLQSLLEAVQALYEAVDGGLSGDEVDE